MLLSYLEDRCFVAASGGKDMGDPADVQRGGAGLNGERLNQAAQHILTTHTYNIYLQHVLATSIYNKYSRLACTLAFTLACALACTLAG